MTSYRAGDRIGRVETERFHRFTYDEIITRDKASLDVFWLRDESLEDAANLPEPHILAAEIVEDLEAALAEFSNVAASLAQLAASAEQAESAEA
ncbi:MAG: methyltransferase [Candidatus Eremiobacteraeota bacterium]|nr:methyltransferase [Candidatus Eremiobacteraeota bacterium]